jgi:hypothetical protein
MYRSSQLRGNCTCPPGSACYNRISCDLATWLHYFLCCYGAAVRTPIQSNSSYLTASSTLFLLLLSACSPVHHFIFPTFLNNDPSISTADFAALPVSASSVLPSANHNSCSAKKECGMVTRRRKRLDWRCCLLRVTMAAQMVKNTPFPMWADNRKDELVDLLSNEVGVIIYMEWSI